MELEEAQDQSYLQILFLFSPHGHFSMAITGNKVTKLIVSCLPGNIPWVSSAPLKSNIRQLFSTIRSHCRGLVTTGCDNFVLSSLRTDPGSKLRVFCIPIRDEAVPYQVRKAKQNMRRPEIKSLVLCQQANLLTSEYLPCLILYAFNLSNIASHLA